jgi:DNA-binding NarL/FixJ family response regulator
LRWTTEPPPSALRPAGSAQVERAVVASQDASDVLERTRSEYHRALQPLCFYVASRNAKERQHIQSASKQPTVRALVVDDHDVFRRGLVRVLRDEGIDIVGEASSGRAAIRLAAELCPQVVLMDLSMPGIDGLQATRSIVDSGSDARVVMLTIADDDESAIDALLAGAVGYLRKDETLESMVAVVHAVARGDAVVPPHVGNLVLNRLRAQHVAPVEDPRQPLSKRELEVLQLIVDGRDNAAIAAELFISPNTVKNHVASIFEKLDVANRLQASVQALRRGLVA